MAQPGHRHGAPGFFVSSHIAQAAIPSGMMQRARTTIPLGRWSGQTNSEEMMAENERDPLDVPMDQVITKGGVGDPKASEAKGDAGPAAGKDTPKLEGSHTQETVDPAERLPEDPEEQNDLA